MAEFDHPDTEIEIISDEDAEQLQLPLNLSDPAPEIRPEYNIGKYAGYIFASPYAKNLYEERVYRWRYERDDQTIEASVAVVPLKGRKTPTTTTLRVFYGLIEAWRQHGRPADGVVVFSARALTNIMGIKWAGSKTAKMIADQLEILKSTQIKYVRAYKNVNNKLELGGSLNIIDDESYTQRSDLFNDEKFQVHQRVRLNREMVENMLADHIRPLNYEAFKQISNDTAANLYSLLDMYLSDGKMQWERLAHGLLTKELGLQGARYKQKKHRRALLKKLVAELDGKPLFSGRLKLTIRESTQVDDDVLVARKVDVAEKPKKPRVTKINDPEDARLKCEDIVATLRQFPNGGKPNHGFILFLCEVYPFNILDQALALTKADFREDGKDLSKLFTSEVRRLITKGGKYKWWDESYVPKEPFK